MRAWVIFSTDAGSAVTAQIASDLLEPTITARPRIDRLKALSIGEKLEMPARKGFVLALSC